DFAGPLAVTVYAHVYAAPGRTSFLGAAVRSTTPPSSACAPAPMGARPSSGAAASRTRPRPFHVPITMRPPWPAISFGHVRCSERGAVHLTSCRRVATDSDPWPGRLICSGFQPVLLRRPGTDG